VRLWDAATGALLQILKGHTGLISSVTFSYDCNRIISGLIDWTVRLWDAATGALLQIKGHINSVSSVVFSRDGKQVISGSDNGTVWLWDAAMGAILQTLESHVPFPLAVRYVPPCKYLVNGY
jgi:WD40 repeat protein